MNRIRVNKILNSCLIFTLISIASLQWMMGQGFDWQYSARLPYNIPKLYGGAGGQLNYFFHNVNLRLFSDIIPECCSFDNGIGRGYSLFIQVEYWESGNMSIYGKILYNDIKSNFKIQQKFPYYDTLTNSEKYYRYETEAETRIGELMVNGGVRYRILETHFYIGAGINIGVNIWNSISAVERVLDTDENWFPNEPDPHQRTYPGSRISELNLIILTPELRVGYDLNLGKNFYATIATVLGFNMISMTRDDNWHFVSGGIGVTILRALD